MAAGGVRIPHARLLVLAPAVAVCAGILWLAREYTFLSDEWTFITTAPDWTARTLFQPHNEHPSILFRVVYALLLDTVGLRSYVPYMAVLVLLHLANVVLLFELVRRRAGDLAGIAAGLLLATLGAGWNDMLWAFQMAWLASMALGLGSLLVLQGHPRLARAPVAAMLLAGSLAFSGIGLVFGVAATALLALTPGRRKDLAWLVPVGFALLAWYVLFGRLGNHPNPQPTAANLFLLPAFVGWGLGAGAGGVVGVSGWTGVACLAATTAAIGWRWWRRGTDAFAVSIALALLFFYVVIGMARAQLGYAEAASSRYIYVGSALVLILLADIVGDLHGRSRWRPVLAVCLTLACLSNLLLLVGSARIWALTMQRQAADYYALSAMRSDACLDPAGAVDLKVMPVETRPAAYYRAIDKYGDPRAGLPLVDRASYEAGLRHLRRADCSSP